MCSNGIAGYGSSSFSFLRKLHNIFHNGCINLYFHQHTQEFHFLHILANTWYDDIIISPWYRLTNVWTYDLTYRTCNKYLINMNPISLSKHNIFSRALELLDLTILFSSLSRHLRMTKTFCSRLLFSQDTNLNVWPFY
jgi:hypothetical protein